ncbi:MAG: enoyl-CoA hydratase/isomerase family protein [Sphingomonadales bacterium]|nr:enoyl-CoA hydratase/isomerase family protein [Sphingomonadales bacterium]
MSEMSRRAVLVAGAAIPAMGAAGAAQAAGEGGQGFKTLTYEAKGPVAVITLVRPEQDNLIDAEMLRELPAVWKAFQADDSLRVAIFTATGDTVFCGGADTASYRDAPSPAYIRRDEGIRTYTAKQNKCWKPVIAAINGFVVGPGLHFLLDADICISVPDATFCDMHMHRSGAVPVIEPIEMARKIPQEAVSRMFLLGAYEPISAQRALELGLISELISHDRLMARALELAGYIAQADMHLTTAFIESFYKARELGVSEAINRGLIIRQATGYRPAQFGSSPIRDVLRGRSKS